jgi:salicylate hydroxylase
MVPSNPIEVVIVGAGLGGTACAIACAQRGMQVTLLEQSPKFFPLGDGVGFGSNATKLLKRWGLYDDMWAISCRANESIMRNFDGTILARDDTLAKAEERYGHRGLIGHRGHYHAIFIEHAKRNGVDVRMGQRIERYDVNKPSVFLAGGEELVADVVIAADGVKSLGRTQVLGYEDAPIHSGYAVWRAYCNADIFKDDELVAEFLKEGSSLTSRTILIQVCGN